MYTLLNKSVLKTNKNSVSGLCMCVLLAIVLAPIPGDPMNGRCPQCTVPNSPAQHVDSCLSLLV